MKKIKIEQPKPDKPITIDIQYRLVMNRDSAVKLLRRLRQQKTPGVKLICQALRRAIAGKAGEIALN